MRLLNAFIFLLALLGQYCNAQVKDSSIIDFRAVVKDGTGYCISTSKVKETEPIKGCFFQVGQGDSAGVGTNTESVFDFLSPFIYDLPNKSREDRDSIMKLVSARNEDIDSLVRNMPDYGKIFSYYILPQFINSAKDSIALFFKYSFDSLLSSNDSHDYKYDKKLYYKFIVVPLNKINSFGFINEHFKNKEVYFIFSRTDSSKENLYSRFTTSHFDEIKKLANTSEVKNMKFGLSAEFIRSNLLENNILIRQLDFPMEGENIIRGSVFNVPTEIPITVYSTSFRLPDTSMINNIEVKQKGNGIISYNLFLVPLNFSNNELTFELFIDCNTEFGKGLTTEVNSILKRITLKKGDSLKLNIIGGLFENMIKSQNDLAFEKSKSPKPVDDLFVISFDSVYGNY